MRPHRRRGEVKRRVVDSVEYGKIGKMFKGGCQIHMRGLWVVFPQASEDIRRGGNAGMI